MHFANLHLIDNRLAFLMMSKYVRAVVSHIVSTTPSSSSKTRHILCMVLRCVCGLERTRSAPKQYVTYEGGPKPTFTIHPTRRIGFHIAYRSCRGILCTIYWATIYEACGFTGTRRRTFFTPKKFPAFSAFPLHDLMTWYGST